MNDSRPSTPHEVLSWCRQSDVKAVELRFTDLLGRQTGFTIPVDKLTIDVFEDGLGVDGSRLRGGQSVKESDLIATPEARSAFIDPFCAVPTAVLLCNLQAPLTREDYPRDPRNIARKAVDYLQASGVADACLFSPECEFYLFAGAGGAGASAPTDLETLEGRMAGVETAPSLPPVNSAAQLGTEMMLELMHCGLDVERREQTAASGRHAIQLKGAPLLEMADALATVKYVVKQVAARRGVQATFMPKPLANDRGAGLHTQLSLWRQGKPLFAGSGYAGLSDVGLWAIGGLLRHAPALAAICNPTTNSYRRLASGGDATIELGYSARNRAAACRIPMLSQNPEAKCIDFRTPDASCNPYLAFAAILMAMLDGVQNKFSPGEPLESETADAEGGESRCLQRRMPLSLDGALSALAQDHEFLLRGDVFTQEVIDAWIECKQREEIAALRCRPHPHEFTLYFDA